MTGYTRHARAAASYREALGTQTSVRQIVQLYDMAILRLKEAKAAIQELRIEDRHHAVMKAFAILAGLQSCLDFERGGEIAPQLDSFYSHALNRILLVNQKNDPAICDEVVAQLAPMRASWAEIADGAAPTSQAAGPQQPGARPASIMT